MPETLGWGAGGIQAFKHDQAVEAQTEMNRIAMGVEQAKLQRAEAEAEAEAKADALTASIFRGDGSGGADGGSGDLDRADALMHGGETLIAAGATKRGMELIELGSKLRKEDRLAAQAENSTLNSLMDRKLKQADLIAQELGHADTPEAQEHGLANLRDSGFFEEDQLEVISSMSSDPKRRKLFLQQSMSAAEQARLELARLNSEALADHRASTTEIAERNAQRLEGIATEQRRANRVREKAGGPDIGATPTGPQVNTIVATLRNSILKGRGVSPDQEDNVTATFTAAAPQLFSRAQELLKEDRARSFDQALTIAITESEAAGDWNFADTWYGGKEDEPTFAPVGKTAENPLPKPSNGRYVAGRYYTNSDGAVAKWTGKGFEPVE